MYQEITVEFLKDAISLNPQLTSEFGGFNDLVNEIWKNITFVGKDRNPCLTNKH